MSAQTENEYEDLLSLWADLECGLGVILGSPDSVQEFVQRVRQYDRWMQALLERDTDVGLYLLFQLVANSSVGYSASHALVCAVLCHLIAVELDLNQIERDSLVRAALTMNVAMTGLQDQLAHQINTPTVLQQTAIRAHGVHGALKLSQRGVLDSLWLDTVALHHTEHADVGPLLALAPVQRLVRVLQVVDRYAAMISPRQSRVGRSATDSMRSIFSHPTAQNNQIGHALVRVIGLYPPGTYVQLDTRELAVVVRRSGQSGQPLVAIVLSADSVLVQPPRLHHAPEITAALPASALRERLNHHRILQLGLYAAQVA